MSFFSPGFSDDSVLGYGFLNTSVLPLVFSSETIYNFKFTGTDHFVNYGYCFTVSHYTDKEYRCSPSKYILADFSYDNYKDLRHEVAQQIA